MAQPSSNKKSLNSKFAAFYSTNSSQVLPALIASQADLCLHPFDTLSKRSQTLKVSGSEATQVIAAVRPFENNKLFAGIGIAAVNKAASRTLRWSFQDQLRERTEARYANKVNSALNLSSEQSKVFFGATTGIATGLVESFIFQPLDTIKTRRQVRISLHSNLYAGIGANAARTSISAGSFFASYQGALSALSKDKNNSTNIEKLGSATLAGEVTAIVSNPFDVVKTRQQAESGTTKLNMVSMFHKIAKQEGIRAFAKGLEWKILNAPLRCSLPFFAFQVVKGILESTHVQPPVSDQSALLRSPAPAN